MSKLKPAPLPPGAVVGGYQLIRKLSSGGFGIVYLALDPEGQQVAVKEYLPSSLAAREPEHAHLGGGTGERRSLGGAHDPTSWLRRAPERAGSRSDP